jgi:hypothetical protein
MAHSYYGSTLKTSQDLYMDLMTAPCSYLPPASVEFVFPLYSPGASHGFEGQIYYDIAKEYLKSSYQNEVHPTVAFAHVAVFGSKAANNQNMYRIHKKLCHEIYACSP